MKKSVRVIMIMHILLSGFSMVSMIYTIIEKIGLEKQTLKVEAYVTSESFNGDESLANFLRQDAEFKIRQNDRFLIYIVLLFVYSIGASIFLFKKSGKDHSENRVNSSQSGSGQQ